MTEPEREAGPGGEAPGEATPAATRGTEPRGVAAVGGGPPPVRLSVASPSAGRFTDGEWHRLHPATPLLRGGIVFIAVLGFVLSNLRERIVAFFVGAPDFGGDPLDEIYDRGWQGWALLAVVAVLIGCLALFSLSWQMHTFRITGDAVEVRSGILFRTQRKARLDRIQGINVVRPLLARLFGAAKLDITVAGHDANVQLAYLGSALADGLRGDVLRLASGARTVEAGPAPAACTASTSPSGAVGEAVNRRVSEFLAPELDPGAASPESVVKIPPLRLLGSLLVSGFSLFVIAVFAVFLYGASSGAPWLLIVALPGLIGSASLVINRFTKSLRYSIAGTPDGVRVGFGFLSTSNETLPPGRVHAVEAIQPLLWRPFGWWQIRIDTAGRSREKGAAGQANTTILPVGDLADIARVLSLVLPGFATDENRATILAGMTSRGRDDFTGSPVRAAWVRPLSWRRTGYRNIDGALLLRRGFVWRSLAIVPLARLQSLELLQGPVDRALGLTAARFHTVSGPVRPRLAAIDAETGVALFETVSTDAIAAARSDQSHRWGAPIVSEASDEPDPLVPSDLLGLSGLSGLSGSSGPSGTAVPLVPPGPALPTVSPAPAVPRIPPAPSARDHEENV
ncbi:hypothetical protein ATY41_04540 [Leifsonia xyli subsp. xyli]|uniref:YdbS-like PH domain-containing protein n=2 Tax=Leifsonia xyli subsp. xyli TaxID=59736 RepID=Q6ACQ6_LEIXX|nr:PH domain-containing protein [Leifsonia xyli]AAT89837.1 conserved hypothetical protein [Leifsonia xyli subsp. xyli str. CTCB07]ODA89553.1 hypothetical protein ATY41_04540 [Leifsonia xyli subsp. xyli]